MVLIFRSRSLICRGNVWTSAVCLLILRVPFCFSGFGAVAFTAGRSPPLCLEGRSQSCSFRKPQVTWPWRPYSPVRIVSSAPNPICSASSQDCKQDFYFILIFFSWKIAFSLIILYSKHYRVSSRAKSTLRRHTALETGNLTQGSETWIITAIVTLLCGWHSLAQLSMSRETFWELLLPAEHSPRHFT